MQLNTLADIRQRCQDRFDASVNNYISTTQWNTLINEAAAHLHNWIITSDEDYISKRYPIQLTAGVNQYSLPSDFFKDQQVFGVWTSPTGSGQTQQNYWPMRRLMVSEYRGNLLFYNRMFAPMPGGYLINGQQLILSAAPTDSNTSIEMWYCPHFTPLVNDGDILDISVTPGWDEFIVNQVVINAKIKEESDPSALMARQTELKAAIETDMINRDMGRPRHVVDASIGLWGAFPYGAWGLTGWEF